MVMFYVLGFVVCIAIAVVGFLFYLLGKETKHPSEELVVPIINSQEFLRPTLDLDLVDKHKKRVEELEEELRAISEKGVAQAQEAMLMVESLTKENQSLKDERFAKEGSQRNELSQALEHAEKLRLENDSIQTRLESSEARFTQMQEEIVLIRKQTGEELEQSRAVIEQFKATQASASTQSQELLELRIENEKLRSEAESLRSEDQKLKDLNAQLLEKSQSLQYEITKNRAQVSGLERICENYKSQLGRLYETQSK